MTRDVAQAVLVAALAGCGPGAPEVEATWARWFTFGAIEAAQAAPHGEFVAVVVGSTADVVGPGAPSSAPERGVFVLDDRGGMRRPATLADAAAVAIDDDGTAYALVPDAGPGRLGRGCRLVAVDVDGATRWERPWPIDDDGGVGCAAQPFVAGDQLVLRDEAGLAALSRDGAVRWTSSLASGCDDLKWRADALWCAEDPVDGSDVTIVRCDPADGACRSIRLADTIDQVPDFDVSTDAIILRDCTFDWPTQDCRVVAFDHDGRRRWSTPRDPGAPLGPGPFVVATRRGTWLIGSHHTPSAGETSQRELSLRHLTADGHVDRRLRRRFVDAPGDAIAREQCPSEGDAVRGPEGGSATQAVLRLEGDGLLVVGQHGCRDAFVLALEERP